MYYDDSEEQESTSYYCAKCHRYNRHNCVAVQYIYNSEMICIHPSWAWTSAPLPRDSVQWNLMTQSGFLQYSSLYYLAVKRIVNWCPSLSPLYPIFTSGDGNCLMNAVSQYIRAQEGIGVQLRQTVYKNLANCSICAAVRERWQSEREWQNANIPDGGLYYTDEEWDREWEKVVSAAANQLQKNPYMDAVSYEYLEEIHVFTLANVLRRPIIVLGEPFTYGRAGDTIEQNSFVGIYLPLLSRPKSCYPMPVVIAFIGDHFQPLLHRSRSSLSSEAVTTLDAVPLVTADLEPLRIHFLLPSEQGSVANKLLLQYLNTFEAEFCGGDDKQMVLCAHLYNGDEDAYIRNAIALSESASRHSSHNDSSSPATKALQYGSHYVSSHHSTTRPVAVPEDEQCSRTGCSKRAVMKPPASIVLLPLANRNKVLTYCRDRSLQCNRNSLKSRATSTLQFCQEHAPSGSTAIEELSRTPAQHESSDKVVSPFPQSENFIDEADSISEDFDDTVDPYIVLIGSGRNNDRTGGVSALLSLLLGPHKCKTPTCDNAARNNGYCVDCQNKPTGRRNLPAVEYPNGDTSADDVEGVLSSERCEVKGGECTSDGTAAELQQSADCSRATEADFTDERSANAREYVDVGSCRGPYCNNAGLEQYRGLCKACYRTLYAVNYRLHSGASPHDIDDDLD